MEAVGDRHDEPAGDPERHDQEAELDRHPQALEEQRMDLEQDLEVEEVVDETFHGPAQRFHPKRDSTHRLRTTRGRKMTR